MNRKSLCVLIALGLGAASVQAQDYDDRYYFAPYLGVSFNDEDRLTDRSSFLLGVGIGRFINPNSAIDVFVDRTTRDNRPDGQGVPSSGQFANTVVGVALRHHFGSWEAWRPYVMAGGGISYHDRAGSDSDYDPFVQAGVGISKAITDRVSFRGEVAYRYDTDDDSLEFINGEDDFGDALVTLGLTVALGGADEAMIVEDPPMAPPPADCSTLDDDRDGVNNCDDKCPDSTAGQVVGPDGCAQDVVIDLRGVNFKFDYPKRGFDGTIGDAGLVEGSAEILQQAVDVLTRYPQLRVAVDGHTDAIGTDEYNQSLSERRSRVVYDYLTANGIDAGRLVGPNGYGESRPIDTNDTAEGRARNRRTELPVQK